VGVILNRLHDAAPSQQPGQVLHWRSGDPAKNCRACTPVPPAEVAMFTEAGDPRPRMSATLVKASSSAAISTSARAPGARRSPWSVLARLGRGEKVGEQLGDALSLVMMDPVRGVGQALDAVEVGHVVVLRLG
jgi:hypothetical protein